MTVWIAKAFLAAVDPVRAEPPKKIVRRATWAVIPVVALLVLVAYFENLPLRAEFLFNRKSLQRISDTPARPVIHSPVGKSISYTVQYIEKDGPRVNLLLGGINGVGDRRYGFQHITDGSPPRYPSVRDYLPLGDGWYVFRADRPTD